ncbi:MAG: hypothetical protein HY063_09110 [Bacteroidetes bacterium]|nr:hypothetical protein [Bacteroidota bacterium]
MLNRFFSFILFGIVLFLLVSCGSNEQSTDTTSVVISKKDSANVDALTQFKYDKLISNVPIPFDILRMHADAQLSYTSDAVNSTSNLPYYYSSTQKALNLGIYGGDLAYSITYEKFDEMGNYLKCAKKLADDLGIPLAFDQTALATYKKYGTNKDSLEKIVFNSYSEVDKTLKSNERIGLASLVVTGGWIEGLFATLKTLGSAPKNDKTKNLYKKIWEQKNHLDMIIGLLEQFKEEIAYVNLVIDLKDIKNVYDHLSDKSDINESEMASLNQKVSLVRSKIISH